MKHTKKHIILWAFLYAVLMLAFVACEGEVPQNTSSGDRNAPAPSTQNSEGSGDDSEGNDASETDAGPSSQQDGAAASGASGGKAVETLLCYTYPEIPAKFGGIAIIFSEEWGEHISLEPSDIAELTVYVNGSPRRVTGFRVSKWPEWDEGGVAYHIWFDENFTEYPADYRVSLVVHGQVLKPEDFDTLRIDADGATEYLERDG